MVSPSWLADRWRRTRIQRGPSWEPVRGGIRGRPTPVSGKVGSPPSTPGLGAGSPYAAGFRWRRSRTPRDTQRDPSTERARVVALPGVREERARFAHTAPVIDGRF